MGTPDVGLAKGSGLYEEQAAVLLFTPCAAEPPANKMVTKCSPTRDHGLLALGSHGEYR